MHLLSLQLKTFTAGGSDALGGGNEVDVGVGEDGGEVGNEMSPLSLSTLPHSPSSWQKVDREPALLPTNLINRDAEAGGGGGGGGGGAEATCAD